MEPNDRDRVAIPELDIEVGIHEKWMRFWRAGKLQLLPEEIWKELNLLREQNSR